MIVSHPLVSVIIPVKNGARFLAAAIQSVLAQDYSPCEIIVVVGPSDDATPRIVQSFNSVRSISQYEESGIAGARNLGIAAARGEFIAFNSSDDVWASDKLSAQIEYMLVHPEIQYTLTRVKFFLEQGCSVPPAFKRELLMGDYVGTMSETLVSRKSLFQLIGGFNPDYVVNEDTEWFLRAKDRQVPGAVIPRVLVYKRIHDQNTGLGKIGATRSNQTILKAAKQSIDRKRDQSSLAD